MGYLGGVTRPDPLGLGALALLGLFLLVVGDNGEHSFFVSTKENSKQDALTLVGQHNFTVLEGQIPVLDELPHILGKSQASENS